MVDGIVQLNVDGTGKKVDTSELIVGDNTVERQRINISDSVDINAHARVKENNEVNGSEAGLIVRGFIHDIGLSIKRKLDILANAVGLAIDPTTGAMRALATVSSGTITTVTTVTTCTTCASLTSFNGQNSQFTLLYANERQNWSANVRGRIS